MDPRDPTDPTESSVDLVLPFYGPPERLRETVRSVLAQTSPRWRLLVVDDAWPHDDVAPWLRALGDERIGYRRNPVNLGVNANFQHCLELARAPYVAFPGGDDVLLPTYVETVLRVAERTGADVVQPGVVVIDAAGRRVVPLADRVKSWLAPSTRAGDAVLAGDDLVASLATGNWAYFPSLCFRTGAAQAIGFRAGLDTAQDLQLLMDLAFTGARLAVAASEAFGYRRHAESLSQVTARTSERFEEEAAVLDRAAARSRERGWRRAARRAALRPSSRLHALSLVPGALGRDRVLGRRLLRHALGGPVR